MRYVVSALVALVPLSGCGPKAPDSVQIERGVDRSKAVRAETQKRVDDLNETLDGK